MFADQSVSEGTESASPLLPSFHDCSPSENRPPVGTCLCGILFNSSTGEVKPKMCGSWNCERCGKKNVAKWVLRIEPHSWRWFLTLTLDCDGAAVRENFQRLARGWGNVRKYLKRHGMGNYTWVREQGHNATRRVHLHVIFDGPRQEVGCAGRCRKGHQHHVWGLRRSVELSGLGIWFKLEKVRSTKHVKRYVTKYLSKDLSTHHWPKYTRRIQSTIPRGKPEAGWHFILKPKFKRRTWFVDNCGALSELLSLTKKEKLAQDERQVWLEGAGWPSEVVEG